jgi:2-amino-4-hydroxy-6-hydroxymethyldihydropteridine diphosphokinase
VRIALVAVGSNLPNGEDCPLVTVEKASDVIKNESVRLVRKSECYATTAFPEGTGPDYINACWKLETVLGSDDLLTHLHAVEGQFSREREERWGARTLDIDLLSLGHEILPDTDTHALWREMPLEKQSSLTPDELVLPHPRIQDRPFVLVPLHDIAPDWRHPVTGLTTTEMLRGFPKSEIDAIKPVSSPARKLVKGEDRG